MVEKSIIFHKLFHLGYFIANKIGKRSYLKVKNSIFHFASELYFFNKKKIIYTALIGNYDELYEPKTITKGWRYICFTNLKNIRSVHWEIIQIEVPHQLDDARANRYFKLLSHKVLPKNHFSVYVDARLIVNCNLNQLCFKHILFADMAVSKHFGRQTVKEEALACSKLQRDKPEIIEKQMELYDREGFPDNLPLTSNGLLIRRANQNISTIMEKWWEQVQKYSKRDQLSLNYILWKFPGIHIKYFPFSEFEANFIFQQHNHKKGNNE